MKKEFKTIAVEYPTLKKYLHEKNISLDCSTCGKKNGRFILDANFPSKIGDSIKGTIHSLKHEKDGAITNLRCFTLMCDDCGLLQQFSIVPYILWKGKNEQK